jgi:CRISPR-associated endonuclease/helicase Cas3
MINYPTGQGKTESSIYLSELAGRGEFFSLPTQATSNSIFYRRLSYVDKGQECLPNVELCHSMRVLVDRNVTSDVDKVEELTTDFFNSCKRAMLADYTVGTIDQLALISLRSKHNFLRMFAISFKTIILDEIHNSSPYSRVIVLETIKWLKQLGCNVIVLSATLSSDFKKEILGAFAEEAAITEEETKTYPSLIVAQDKDIIVRPISCDPKYITISPHKSKESVVESWRPLVQDSNFTGIFFCNTVMDAQSTYSLIKNQLK